MAPDIIEPPSDKQVAKNHDVSLTCRVSGIPKPKIKWFHNEEKLSGERYEMKQNGDLYITFAQSDDAGNYTCFAENKLGYVSATVNLEIK